MDMDISTQIKRYRKRKHYSQEELAHKVYVSRQTISNWENGHSYPDIQTLLMLSVLFDVSLDTLVKGDVDMMKTEIALRENTMNRWAWIMTFSYFGAAVAMGPLVNFTHIFWTGLLLILFGIAAYAAFKIERIKKEHKLDTYEKIVAFSEGRSTEKVESKKGWKDYLSLFGMPLAFVIVSIFSIYIFSLI